MEKTLLYEAYATLTAAERREFGKFVRSPFFNQKPALVALCDYLCGCCERGEVPRPEGAWEAIHPTPDPSPNERGDEAHTETSSKHPAALPNEDTNAAALHHRTRHASPPVGGGAGGGVDQKLRLANSNLLALLEHYWMYREKFADGDRAKIRLAGAYRKRKLGKHFDITLREARQARERQPWRTADYFHDLNLLEWEQYQWDSSSKRSESLNLQATSDFMDKAFIARKLRLACLALSHQAVFKIEYQLGLLDAVLKYLETSDLEETPTVGLYFHCYHFLADPTAEQHFERFREMLFAHADTFPEDELRTLYLLAINFGIKKINEQQVGWLRNTLDLYQHALARQLLLENGHISRFAFNNIAGIALRLGEVDWAECFVQQHQHFLEKQHRRSTAAFNLARVAYARHDYGTALLHLQEAVDRDVFSNLQAKTLQLKIYYETNEWEALESHLASMKTYIRRHARIAYQRDNYLRILLYAKQLMQLDRAKPAAVAKLHEQIAAEQSLTEREWLMEQVGAG